MKEKIMLKRLGFNLHEEETTIFFLKACLLSFWIGADLIAALAYSMLAPDNPARHGFFIFIAITILISGTLFSILIVSGAGSLFVAKKNEIKNGLVSARPDTLKRRSYGLIGVGCASTLVLLVVFASHFIFHKKDSKKFEKIASVDAVIFSKCAEIANLEKSLFLSNEQSVIAECLTQYGEKNASLVNLSVQENQ